MRCRVPRQSTSKNCWSRDNLRPRALRLRKASWTRSRITETLGRTWVLRALGIGIANSIPEPLLRFHQQELLDVLESWDVGQIIDVREFSKDGVFLVERRDDVPLVLKNLGEASQERRQSDSGLLLAPNGSFGMARSRAS